MEVLLLMAFTVVAWELLGRPLFFDADSSSKRARP